MALTSHRRVLVARVALGSADTGGGILSWQNPHENAIGIVGFYVELTTVASAACTADFGTTTTSATTSANNLITGVDLNSATGFFDNNTDKGASGKTRQKLAAGGWVTGSKASGAAAGLAGMAYIEYIVLA